MARTKRLTLKTKIMLHKPLVKHVDEEQRERTIAQQNRAARRRLVNARGLTQFGSLSWDFYNSCLRDIERGESFQAA